MIAAHPRFARERLVADVEIAAGGRGEKRAHRPRRRAVRRRRARDERRLAVADAERTRLTAHHEVIAGIGHQAAGQAGRTIGRLVGKGMPPVRPAVGAVRAGVGARLYRATSRRSPAWRRGSARDRCRHNQRRLWPSRSPPRRHAGSPTPRVQFARSQKERERRTGRLRGRRRSRTSPSWRSRGRRAAFRCSWDRCASTRWSAPCSCRR